MTGRKVSGLTLTRSEHQPVAVTDIPPYVSVGWIVTESASDDVSDKEHELPFGDLHEFAATDKREVDLITELTASMLERLIVQLRELLMSKHVYTPLGHLQLAMLSLVMLDEVVAYETVAVRALGNLLFAFGADADEVRTDDLGHHVGDGRALGFGGAHALARPSMTSSSGSPRREPLWSAVLQRNASTVRSSTTLR